MYITILAACAVLQPGCAPSPAASASSAEPTGASPLSSPVAYQATTKADLSSVSSQYGALSKAYSSGKVDSVLAFYSPKATFNGYYKVAEGKVLTQDQPLATFKAHVEFVMTGAEPPKRQFAIEAVSLKGDAIEAKVWVHSVTFFATRDSSGKAGSSEGYSGLVHTWRKVDGKLVISDEKNNGAGFDKAKSKFDQFGGK